MKATMVGIGGALAFLCLAMPADGAVRKVPQQFPTIQAAVDAANPGDRIEIAKKRNFENVKVNTRRLTIVGVRSRVFVDGHDNVTGKDYEFAINANRVRLSDIGIRNGYGIYCNGDRCGFDRLRAGGDLGSDCIQVSGDDASIRRSMLSYCDQSGVSVSGDDALVAGNEIRNAGSDCIEVSGNRATVRNNTATLCEDGAAVAVHGNRALVRGNRGRNTDAATLDVSGNGARVVKNRASSTYYSCVEVDGDRMRVAGNRAASCGLGSSYAGFDLSGENPRVTGNRAVDTADAGFDINCVNNGSDSDACDDALIKGNVAEHATDDDEGFRISQPANTGSMQISGNTAVDNIDYGFYLSVDNALIDGNVARRNGADSEPGFYVSGSGNTLRANVASSNDGDGIRIVGDENRLEKNKTSNNAGDGIEVGSSTNNVLIRNIAMSNFAEGFDNGGTDTIVRRNVARKNRTDCANDGTIAVKKKNKCADKSNFNVPPQVSRAAR